MQRRRIVSVASVTIAVSSLFDSASAQTVSVWNNTSGGSWFTGSNWADGQVPQNSPDHEFDVRIDAFAHLPYVVSFAGDAQVRSLRLNSDRASLRLMSGTLRVEDRADLFAGRLSLVGGTIDGGTWFAAPGTVAIGAHPANELRGVTWIGDLPLVGIGSRLRVSDGLNIHGRILLSGPLCRLDFAGTQAIRADEILLTNTDGTATIFAEDDGVIEIADGTTIRGGGSILGSGRIVNAGSIFADAPAGPLTIAPSDFQNNGSVRLAPGATCVIGANDTSWENGIGGVVTLGGGTLGIRGSWTNAGQVDASGSLLRLYATLATASLQGISSGGTVEMRGTLNNTDSVLDLPTLEATLNFGPSTVRGGMIRSDESSPIRVIGGTTRFDQVVIDGPITLLANGNARILSSAELRGPIRYSAPGRTVQFDADRVLNGQAFVWSDDVGTISAEGTGSLTFGPKQLLAGRRMQITSNLVAAKSTVVVRNEGTIRIPSNGNSAIYPRQFENHGRIEQVGGALTIGVTPNGSPGPSWINESDGVIVATNGTLRFGGAWSNVGLIETLGSHVTLGGTYEVNSLDNFHREEGTLVLSGTVDLLDQELAVGDTLGVINIADLTIRNGAIRIEGSGDYRFVRGTAAGSYLRLRNADFQATLNVRGGEDQPFQVSAEIDRDSSVSGGISLGPFSTLFIESDEPWETEISIDDLASTRIWVGETKEEFVFGPSCSIQGGGVELRRSGVGRVVNRGTIACGYPDQYVTMSCTLINEGEFRVGAGAQLFADPIWSGRFVNAATGTACICGTDATANLADRWENAGVFRIEDGHGVFGTGHSAPTTNAGRIQLIRSTAEFADGLPNSGTIAIDDSSTLHARMLLCVPGSILEFAFATTSASGRIECDTSAAICGVLRIVLEEGFAPSNGETLRLITATTVEGTFDAIEFAGLPGDTLATVVVSGTTVDVQFEQTRGGLVEKLDSITQRSAFP